MMAASSLTSAAATMAEPNRTGLAAAMTAKEMALADTTAPDPLDGMLVQKERPADVGVGG
jgi:hypothetical protein